MRSLLVLLLFIPSFCLGLTFKNGEQVGSYKGIGWPTIEKHGLDSPMIDIGNQHYVATHDVKGLI